VKILVLGLGNDLYGDDGVGLHVVRLLEAEGTAPGGPGNGAILKFEACLLSGAALLDVIRGFDKLLVIDTIVRDEPVTGRVRLLDPADVRDVPGPSPHYISIPQTLEIGRRIGLHMPEVVKLLAVEAGNIYRVGEGLSAEMTARLPDILGAAREAIRELRGAPSPGTADRS
jgi:hydrogenase maturation protease